MAPARIPLIETRADLPAEHHTVWDLITQSRGLVELTATAGYYSMIACTLNAFAIEPEPGADLLPL